MSQAIINAYSQQGGNLPYFVGKQQYGSGWLRSLGRMAFPILKRLVGVATNTAGDMIEGNKSFKDSIVDNTMAEVGDFITPSSGINSLKTRKRSQRRRSKSVAKRRSSNLPLYK